MSLTEDHTKVVVFITAEDGADQKRPVGTGFIASVKEDDGRVFHYAVTAAHVVSQGVPTWVRVRTQTGIADQPAEWYRHPSQDVAVARVATMGWADWRAIPLTALTDLSANPVDLEYGDRVYFIGLLPNIPEMGRQVIPMVRSGTIGRLYQSGIHLEIARGRHVPVTAHLIDCRSYFGFSGSPCLVQRDTMAIPAPGQLGLGTRTHVLGLVSAHFKAPGDEVGHSGVGVVTPSEHIAEALLAPEVAEARQFDNPESRRSEH